MTQIDVAATVRTPVSAKTVRELAASVLRGERAKLSQLSITFVGPARIRTLNREHLRHDYATDVLSFALGDGAVGDVYICPAVAAKSARTYGTSAREETLRLVVHGILHVLGHDHPETGDRTRSPMWKRQERYLEARA